VCAEAGALLDDLADVSPRVQSSLAPHGIYTASDATLTWVAEQSAQRDIPVHLHFLETADEVTGCLDRYDERPAALLDRVGLLSDRLVLAHAVHVGDEEIAALAAAGATLVTNPVSNLKLAVGGVFPWARIQQAGIAVGLGTDGASSNNSLDMLADVKVLALLQKYVNDDPAALPATDAWAIATGAHAPRLRTGAGVGASVASRDAALRVGDAADFFLARGDAPELAPGHTVDNLVYAASGSVVRTTVVDGQVLVRDGVVADEEEVRAKAVECARGLGVV
jgi:5-methylthioadenosine/S-adenosylhomocysteine deaminase